MATEATEATDKKVAPERIWVDLGGHGIDDGQWMDAADRKPEDDGEDPEYWALYVRADAPNTRQRAERAAWEVVQLAAKDKMQCPHQDDIATIIAAEFEK